MAIEKFQDQVVEWRSAMTLQSQRIVRDTLSELRRFGNTIRSNSNRASGTLASAALKLVLDTELVADETPEDADGPDSREEETKSTITAPIFLSLEIENWRSFYGKQRVEFSRDPDSPLTLLFAPNGAGKTAFLNALTWVLFGDFTQGFKRTDDLINHDAYSESKQNTARVSLEFEHLSSTYVITRTAFQDGVNELEVFCDGNEMTAEALGRLFPKPTKDIFFLAAETLNTANLDESESGTVTARIPVKEGIQSFLGADKYKDGHIILKGAIEDNKLKPKQTVTSKQIQNSYKAWQKEENLVKQIEARLNVAIPKEMAKISEKLGKLEGFITTDNTDEIPSGDNALEKQLESHKKKEKAINKEYDKAVNTLRDIHNLVTKIVNYGHVELLEPAVTAVQKRLDFAESQKLIPPEISPAVIERSLDTGHCFLCETELTADSRKRVEGIGQLAASLEATAAANEARGISDSWKKQKELKMADLVDSISAIENKLELKAKAASPQTLNQVIGLVSGYRSQAEDKLQTAQDKKDAWKKAGEVSQLALIRDYSSLKNQETDLVKEQKELKGDLDKSRIRAKNKQEEYEQRTKSDAETHNKALAQKYLSEAADFFQNLIDGTAEWGRKDVEETVNEIYKRVIKKPYHIKVSEEFGYTLTNAKTNKAIAPSQSEAVLLATSYVGSLARLAPLYQSLTSDRFEKVGHIKNEDLSKAAFPLVIDAPTSALDDEYESELIENIHELGHQVIIPVSGKSVEKWESVIEKVGKTYIMHLEGQETTDRKIRWRGKAHQYASEKPRYLRTSIKEMQN